MACYNACPHSAIAMVEDDWGEAAPVIDELECVDCGRCTAACPILRPVSLHDPGDCYAAWTRDPENRAACSSGGIATTLAIEVLRRGGVVFGTALDDEFALRFSGACSVQEAQRFRGSKYVFGNVGLCYANVNRYLKAGRPVLFVGCPCQVAGLRAYLRHDHESLTTVDLVCHGAPPGRYLQEHLNRVLTRRDNITDVRFRGEGEFRLQAHSGNQTVYSRSKLMDSYYYAFLKGVSYREICYECPYARQARCSDITLGDFWGLDRSALHQDDGGRVSLVLINTEVGRRLFRSVSGLIHKEERSLSEAVSGNVQLRKPSTRHRYRESFLQSYPVQGFERALISSGVTRERLVAVVLESGPVRRLRLLKRRVRSSGAPRRSWRQSS